MFAGLISKEQSVSAWGDPDKIMVALAPYSLDKPRNVWASDKQMLVQVATRTGSTSAEIYQHTESGIAVAFWGRLDNRPDLIAQLNAEHKASDDELIALAWLKWGEFCPEKLIGDFAFAVVSPSAGIVFLARDVMGVKPLFYRADQYGVFFASTAAAFKPLKLGTLTRSEKWMTEYMLGLSYSHTETAYEEIKKLQGAHGLLIHADGRMNLRRYHQFVDDAPIEKKRDPKYLEAYRAAWQEAVACRMPASGNIGTENSGGLDSGSITAELAKQLGRTGINRLHSIGFCYASKEREFISATVKHCGIINDIQIADEFSGDEPVIRKRIIDTFGYPHEDSNSQWHYPFYQYCQKHAIADLFSGFGGDEVVTCPGTLHVRAELFTQGNWAALWQILTGKWPHRCGRMAMAAWRSKFIPKRNNYFLSLWKDRWQYQFVQQKLLDQFDLESRYYATATYDEGFRKVNDAALYLLSRSYASTRLENGTVLAAGFGVDYVWPMWDQRLIQQWLSTPAIWKVGDGGTTRNLHRAAVAGIGPDKVVWKASKGMGVVPHLELAEKSSNETILQGILNLTEALPLATHDVYDIAKLRRMAVTGIKEDWRGEEVNYILTKQLKQLQIIHSWFES
jgi:asparagine synthase (glutamine-hydrolysing)